MILLKSNRVISRLLQLDCFQFLSELPAPFQSVAWSLCSHAQEVKGSLYLCKLFQWSQKNISLSKATAIWLSLRAHLKTAFSPELTNSLSHRLLIKSPYVGSGRNLKQLSDKEGGKILRTCFFKRQFLSPPKHSVSPSWGSALITCIISLWANIILICWSKINSPFMEVFKNLWKEIPSLWLSYRPGRCHCDISTSLQTNNIVIFKQITTFVYYKHGSENATFSLSQGIRQSQHAGIQENETHCLTFPLDFCCCSWSNSKSVFQSWRLRK